jgi:hypothetical protein
MDIHIVIHMNIQMDILFDIQMDILLDILSYWISKKDINVVLSDIKRDI